MQSTEIDKNELLDVLQALVNAEGILIVNKNNVVKNGNVPSDNDIDKILKICSNKLFFASSTLSSYIGEISKDSMGIIFIGLNSGQYIIFFRSEMVQTLLWAGKPEKIISQHKEVAYISPRESFETFKRIEEGKKYPMDTS